MINQIERLTKIKQALRSIGLHIANNRYGVQRQRQWCNVGHRDDAQYRCMANRTVNNDVQCIHALHEQRCSMSAYVV